MSDQPTVPNRRLIPDPEMVRKVAEAVADHCEQKVILRDEVVRVALTVAEPLIREQIAQEIERRC